MDSGARRSRWAAIEHFKRGRYARSRIFAAGGYARHGAFAPVRLQRRWKRRSTAGDPIACAAAPTGFTLAQGGSRMRPQIPFEPWRETLPGAHLYSQVVGKYRLARTPWLNHSWHATLLCERGGIDDAASFPMARRDRGSRWILIGHQVRGAAGDRPLGGFPARGPVGRAVPRTLSRADPLLGGTAQFDGRPNEIADPVAFADDHAARPYDARAVERSIGPSWRRPRARPFPHRLSRQGEPGPPVLGELRPRGDALLRARRAPHQRHHGRFPTA